MLPSQINILYNNNYILLPALLTNPTTLISPLKFSNNHVTLRSILYYIRYPNPVIQRVNTVVAWLHP